LTARKTGSDAVQNRLDIFRQDRCLALPDVGSSTRWGGIPTRQQCGAESVSRTKQGRQSIQIILHLVFGETLGLSISGGRRTEYDMDTRLQHSLWITKSIMCGYVWLYFIHLRPCLICMEGIFCIGWRQPGSIISREIEPGQRFPPFQDEGRRRWEAPSSPAGQPCLHVVAFRSAGLGGPQVP